MNPTQARRDLDALANQTRTVRDALRAQLDTIRDDRDISEDRRRALMAEARDSSAEQLRALKQRTDATRTTLDGYRAPAPSDAAITRAAGRVSAMLDAGITLHEVANVAARSRDAAMIEAVREAAPSRIAIDQSSNGGRIYGTDSAAALADFTRAADIATVHTLTGDDRTRAADAVLGRAQADLVALELNAVRAEATGAGVPGLGHAVTMRFAQQEAEALAARLAETTD